MGRGASRRSGKGEPTGGDRSRAGEMESQEVLPGARRDRGEGERRMEGVGTISRKKKRMSREIVVLKRAELVGPTCLDKGTRGGGEDKTSQQGKHLSHGSKKPLLTTPRRVNWNVVFVFDFSIPKS